MRGLLLGSLVPWFRSRVVLAIAAGVIFAGIHPVYVWLDDDLLLPPIALATLLAFGVATNLLFLRSGHVAFSFAVHAAWNLTRFGGIYVVKGRQISEAQSFGVIEGSGIALGVAATLLALVLILEWIDKTRRLPWWPGRSPMGRSRG